MTLIVTINGPETIWLLADRRLSFPGKLPKDDARKLMSLQTTDGVALLGYAGLGSTSFGTEPADWMHAVLRGRNLPLEQSLGVLASAIMKQFPKHLALMARYGVPAHSVVIPAFIGNEARLYTIDLGLRQDRKTYGFRYTRHTGKRITAPRTPRLAAGGSGALYLMKNKKWIRPLLRLVRACDRLKIAPLRVADHLAAINNEVHAHTTDGSVGPRCIVAWRHRTNGVHKAGSAQHFYTGTARDRNSTLIPTIATGIDISGVIKVTQPYLKLLDIPPGQPALQIGIDSLNSDLARLPTEPNEELK